MCSPYNATAGFGESVVVRAHLEGTPEVRDSALLLTDVIQVYELEAEVDTVLLDLYPGQAFPLTTEVTNTGNGPDRFDITVESITGPEGAYIWDIDIPRAYFGELLRDDSKEFDLIINVPEKTLAGTYNVVLNVLSEEEFDGTRIRDTIDLRCKLGSSTTLRITLDPAMESKDQDKRTRKNRSILDESDQCRQRTRYSNAPQSTKLGQGGWDAVPGMNTLSKWMISFALVEDFDTEFQENPPVLLQIPA